MCSNSNPKPELPTQVGMNRWKQETCMSAKSIHSRVICCPLSLHKHGEEYGDQDLILTRSSSNGEMMCP